jgi:curved DNA-binding protein CbpA
MNKILRKYINSNTLTGKSNLRKADKIFFINKKAFNTQQNLNNSSSNNNINNNLKFKKLEEQYLHLDYFSILNVTPKSEKSEIKKQYYSLAKIFHPDYYKGSPAIFKKITEAYKTLTIPKLREKYTAKMNIKSKINKKSDTENNYDKDTLFKQRYRRTSTYSNENSNENSGENEFFSKEQVSKFQKIWDKMDHDKLFNKFYKLSTEQVDLQNYKNSSSTLDSKEPSVSRLSLDDKTLEKLGEIRVFKSDKEKKMTRKEYLMTKHIDSLSKDRRSRSVKAKAILKEMMYEISTTYEEKIQNEKIEQELNTPYNELVKDYSKKSFDENKKINDSKEQEKILNQKKIILESNRLVVKKIIYFFSALSVITLIIVIRQQKKDFIEKKKEEEKKTAVMRLQSMY